MKLWFLTLAVEDGLANYLYPNSGDDWMMMGEAGETNISSKTD